MKPQGIPIPNDNGAPDTQTAFEQEIAALIVETLNLEDKPNDIVPTAALFNEGLGLDSIDALELSLAIAQRYGVEMKSDDTRNARIFASLRDLAAHIEANRTK